MPKTVSGDKPPVSVVITRSSRRQKTVSARLIDGGATLEILAPEDISDTQLAPIVEKLTERLIRRQERKASADDDDLARRAAELNRQYFDGKLRVASIGYVTNQQQRFGSCTPATHAIRISHRVATMPTWVRDYVIVHELAHLVEANHGARFWKLVNRYPRAERAKGYLIAVGLEGEGDEPRETDLA